MIGEYGLQLAGAVSVSSVAARPGSYCHTVGQEILEMAGAYASDGQAFLRNGDPVNAVAAFAYGFGWLDAGIMLGLIRGCDESKTIPAFPEKIDYRNAEHLNEKTVRYCRMLRDAQDALEKGPDCGSAAFHVAGDFLEKGSCWFERGYRMLKDGRCMNALACFSYGYAWLDAGVRAGLLRITKQRSLFTV